MATTPATTPVVQATGLWKRFGDRIAVQDVSLSVRPGEIIGLVGPNGAGKTTTIRMLLDIIRPDAGDVAIFGAAVTPDARERIGYLPEERGLYGNLRVIPNLLYLAELRGVSREPALRRANELLERLGFEEHRDKKVRELSRGLGQLVQFAATLIHDPAFVVLDEPFSGLDPINVRLMKDIVAELRAAGVAIMFSTHQMTDVEELCDRILMVDDGRLVLEGLLTEIKRRFAGSEVFVASDRASEAIDGVLGSRREGSGYVLKLASGHPPEAVLRTLLDRGAKIDRYEFATPSLEEILSFESSRTVMRKTWLVARHEFSVTLGRLAYRIFVASIPVLAILGLVGVAVLQTVRSDDTSEADTSSATPPETVTVGYVDLTTGEDGQPRFTRFQRQGSTVFTPYHDRQTATGALLEGRIERLFVFPADYLETGTVVEVREESAGLFGAGRRDGALHRFVVENLTFGQVDSERIERIITPYRLVIDEVTESGAPADEDSDVGDSLLFVAVSLLFLVSALTASGYLLQGLSEEKENRIMEVLLSSIEPEHLMLGKLIGLGAASLLQVAVWAVSGVGFLLVLGRMIGVPSELTHVPSAGWLFVAFAYFLLGYALIGTLLAAIGAVTTNQRQAGNITAFVMVPAVVPMWFLPALLDDPDGTLARVLSFVPITAPVASLMRLSLGGMDGLEVFVSLAVLSLSVAIVVWLTARLFRAYLLAYGQSPRMGDLLRTLRGG